MKNLIPIILILFSILFSENSSSQQLSKKAKRYANKGQFDLALEHISMSIEAERILLSNTDNSSLALAEAWNIKGEICEEIYGAQSRTLENPLNVAVESYWRADSLYYLAGSKAIKDYKRKMTTRFILLKFNLITQAVESSAAENYDITLNSFENILKMYSMNLMKDNSTEIDPVIFFNAGLSAYNGDNWGKAIFYFNEAAKYGYSELRTNEFLAKTYLQVNDTIGYRKIIYGSISEFNKIEATHSSYKIGQLTEEQFFNDGWNAKDAFYGKVGIVKMISTSEQLEITLGVIYVGGKLGSEMKALAGFADRDYKNGTPVNYNMNSKNNICVFIFKNGILVEKNYIIN